LEKTIWPTRPIWRSWGDQNLQTGDLVFVRSNYRILLGTFNLSEFLAELGDSPYSHVGIVVIEPEGAKVYDASDKGITSMPFESFVTNGKIYRVAVKRPAQELYPVLPQIVSFVRTHQAEGTTFDNHFEAGVEKIYCTELIVEAFREAGIEICEPTVIGELPGIERVSPISLSAAKWATKLTEQDQVWLPGNDSIGLFASPYLTTVFQSTQNLTR
jgi:hypothetical protein